MKYITCMYIKLVQVSLHSTYNYYLTIITLKYSNLSWNKKKLRPYLWSYKWESLQIQKSILFIYNSKSCTYVVNRIFMIAKSALKFLSVHVYYDLRRTHIAGDIMPFEMLTFVTCTVILQCICRLNINSYLYVDICMYNVLRVTCSSFIGTYQ